MLLRGLITDEMARGMAEVIAQRAAADPAFAEDLESIAESMRYVVRPHEGTQPIICECCGTPVVQCPEALAADSPWTFRPAIWEAYAGRKHTLRRCTWKRDHARTMPARTRRNDPQRSAAICGGRGWPAG